MIARHVNIITTAEYFCAVVMALAAAALVGVVRRYAPDLRGRGDPVR
jgi:hypothetical protein